MVSKAEFKTLGLKDITLTEPVEGNLALVDTVLYIFKEQEFIATWHPLASVDKVETFNKAFSDVWTVYHKLDDTVIVLPVDEEGIVIKPKLIRHVKHDDGYWFTIILFHTKVAGTALVWLQNDTFYLT